MMKTYALWALKTPAPLPTGKARGQQWLLAYYGTEAKLATKQCLSATGQPLQTQLLPLGQSPR